MHKPAFKICLYLFALILIFQSCSRQQIDAPEPIRKLILQTKMVTIADCTSCPPTVGKYLLENKAVYGFTCNGPACNCTIVYYDENGEKLTLDSNDRLELEFVKLIWTCK